MPNQPAQMPMNYKGRRYGGIYSIAGNLMIARIPGIDSRSHAVDGAREEDLARTLLQAILTDAEKAGRLAD